jgi:hypothetical protein
MASLFELVNGYQVSQALHVAAVLGIADRLADGPRSADDLGVEADPDALRRLLRALAAAGVLSESGGRYALTELGQGLRSDVPGSVAAWAAYIGRPSTWRAWSGLVDSVRTGENAFRAVHGVRAYEYRAAHPEDEAVFNAAMTALSRRQNAGVLDAHDFERYGVVVDVGGGQGALLAAILERHPAVRGVLFDQSAVVAGAPAVDRMEVVGGSFFDGVPAGGDAYLLKSVLHNWEDADALAILRSCRDAGAPAVLLVERDLATEPSAAFSDLNMLVGPGGRERTLDEYGALLAAAGFQLTGATSTGLGFSVITADCTRN